VDAGSGGTATDSGADLPDSSAQPKPFKDFRPAAVTFDINACTIQLNGADPSRLNIAIVTPDVGECVRAGECYVPIDRSATAGWQDDGSGNVKLPSYLCKFLDSKGLRLATSSDVCAAKVEANPICTPKLGDDAGIFPVADASGPPDANPVTPFSIPEDFASAVAFDGVNLYFASQSRQGFVNLQVPNAKPDPIGNIATAGSAQLPWRFSVGKGVVGLANGSQNGYVIDPKGAAVPVAFAANIIDVAALDSRFTWATKQAVSSPSFYVSSSPVGNILTSEVQVANVTALAPTPFPDQVLYGDESGVVNLLKPEFMQLGEPSVSTGGRVDNILLTAGSPAGTASGFVLMGNGIYRLTVNASQSTTSTAPFINDLTRFAGVSANGYYFPRTMAFAGQCLLATSTVGLEWFIEQGGSVTASGVLVPAVSQQPILGVAVAPDNTGRPAAYYTVFAQRDAAGGSKGGGIFSAQLPPQCLGGSGGDAGTGADASAPKDSGAPVCGPGNCPTCCTVGGTCAAPQMDTACGIGGSQCKDCTMFASTCNFGNGQCN
jgi:hypothetical protein